MAENFRLEHLEWQALLVLYRHRERESSPIRLVGSKPAVMGLIRHNPPLAAWVGNPANHEIHITSDGLTYYQTSQALNS
jgi:hypothetical protein